MLHQLPTSSPSCFNPSLRYLSLYQGFFQPKTFKSYTIGFPRLQYAFTTTQVISYTWNNLSPTTRKNLLKVYSIVCKLRLKYKGKLGLSCTNWGLASGWMVHSRKFFKTLWWDVTVISRGGQHYKWRGRALNRSFRVKLVVRHSSSSSIS